MEWQPIETAPRDGTPIMLRGVNYAGTALVTALAYFKPEKHPAYYEYWAVAGAEDQDHTGLPPKINFHPTHWMPLPAPPEVQSDE